MTSHYLNFYYNWPYSFHNCRSVKHFQTAQFQVSYIITLPMQQKLGKTQPLVFLTIELLLIEKIDVKNVGTSALIHVTQAIRNGLFMPVACT